MLAEADAAGFTLRDVMARAGRASLGVARHVARRTPASGGADESTWCRIAVPRSAGAGPSPRVNVVAIAISVAAAGARLVGWHATGNPLPLVVWPSSALVAMQSPRIAQQWERAVVLRLGRFVGLRGPGLFWIVPFIDRVSSWIDQRTVTTSFAAEQTLTVRHRAGQRRRRALLDGPRRRRRPRSRCRTTPQAVSWAAQTALRDIIGRTTLTDLLRGRERIETELQTLIDQRSNPWGVTVSSVEMRDIVIPGALQDAMSREAQAAREKQARIILGEAEMEIAHSFQEAAQVLPEQSDRAAPARHEHALRGPEGKGRADAGAEQRRRIDGHGRTDGRRGPAPADPDGIPGDTRQN